MWRSLFITHLIQIKFIWIRIRIRFPWIFRPPNFPNLAKIRRKHGQDTWSWLMVNDGGSLVSDTRHTNEHGHCKLQCIPNKWCTALKRTLTTNNCAVWWSHSFMGIVQNLCQTCKRSRVYFCWNEFGCVLWIWVVNILRSLFVCRYSKLCKFFWMSRVVCYYLKITFGGKCGVVIRYAKITFLQLHIITTTKNYTSKNK